MPACAVCGHTANEPFKFCPECGARATAGGQEQRRLVTVLFCDVVGSTALGETTDPEALRGLLARYFERMKEAVERHGGTVEKFIGDAVMAVFGAPVAHEDDALRACRAAIEMRESFVELGVEGRIGVTTGEVVTGTEERLATGDAVNVAARLQQAAQPGQVLLDKPTLQLVREAAEVEPLEPLELKGKAGPVEAYRLVAVYEPERRHEVRFVGRERELAMVREAWQRAVAEQRCELVTVVGEAGVGKSRLVAEALASVDVRVVQGRCPPYGEGITYWPVVEAIKQLDAFPSDPAAAAALRSVLGESDAGTSAEEIAWAFRKLLEERAPLVVVFDDIQWGEETFLDLIEHVALLSAAAPILLLCMARTDLVERRPVWPTTVRLEPLPEDDVAELIGEDVPAELGERIATTAGGNPLFVAEMLAMVGEAEGDVTVPPTLRALLAARLDQLESAERAVLERGAVEGEIFHRGAAQALSDNGHVTPRLAALVRKGLIRPDTALIPGDDAFRFRHLLIRDAAYDALSKATRADLHERFADWLERNGVGLVELDELVGFHLEQAARYKSELGQPHPGLAERAGERLAAAGRRAVSRSDRGAGVPLLERSLAMTRAVRFDVRLELDLAEAERSAPKKAAIAEQAAERAQLAGDKAGEALALVAAASARAFFADDPRIDEIERLARAALPLLEEVSDHLGLARVWGYLGTAANLQGRFEEWAQAEEKSFRHLRLAGEKPLGLGTLHGALLAGPRPADEALRTLDAALPPNPEPLALLGRARLLAMLCRFDEAWELALRAAERLREVSGEALEGFALGEIAALGGDHAAAADHLRVACDIFERRGNRAVLSTYAPMLGRSLCVLGRYDEAESLARLGRELGYEEDLVTQMLWRQVQALVHAHRGEHAEAESLAREAVGIAERTDGLNYQGDALCDLADVLSAAGRAGEAAAALEQALERYTRKRNLAMVQQVRPKLSELRRLSAPAGSG